MSSLPPRASNLRNLRDPAVRAKMLESARRDSIASLAREKRRRARTGGEKGIDLGPAPDRNGGRQDDVAPQNKPVENVLRVIDSWTFASLAETRPRTRELESAIKKLKAVDADWAKALAPSIAGSETRKAKLKTLQKLIQPEVQIRDVVIPSLAYATAISAISVLVTATGAPLGAPLGVILLAAAAALLVLGLTLTHLARTRTTVTILLGATEALLDRPADP